MQVPKLSVADAPLQFYMKPESFVTESGKDWTRDYLIGVVELQSSDGKKLYRRRMVGINNRSQENLYDWGITDLDVLVGQKIKFVKHIAEEAKYNYFFLSQIPQKLVQALTVEGF